MQEDKKYTKEEIEALKQRDPSELTSQERKLRNLQMFTGADDPRRQNGRKKGSKNWSTYFKHLMSDEKFLKTVITQLPAQWTDVVEECPADVIAAGLIASTTQNVAKAIAEGKAIDKQTLEMIDRISKIGYGEQKKVSMEAEDNGFFNKVNFNFKVVENRPRELLEES